MQPNHVHMRFVPFIVIALFTSVHVLLTWAVGEAHLPQGLIAVLESFHRAVPAWSAFAFGIGWWWLLPLFAAYGWLHWALRRNRSGALAWPAALVSILFALSMLYTMSPPHLMCAEGAI
jgi:hypothetical protein